jgi:hypothetical protein
VTLAKMARVSPAGEKEGLTDLYKMSSETDMGTHGTLQVELIADFSLS